jgi:ATP-binding cassette, subfamily B, bacterial PglK
MIFSSFAEVISIGAVIPFLAALTSPDQIFSNPIAQPLILFLNLTESKQLLLPLTVIFSIAALFSGLMRVILLWAQTRLTYSIGADFSYSIYRRTLYQPYTVHIGRNSSELISGIAGKANTVVGSALLPVASIISSFLIFISILAALIVIEPIIAITSLFGFGLIYLLVMLITKSIIKRDSKRVNIESDRVIKSLQEGFGGIRDVLIDGSQALYAKNFRDADLPLRRAQANISIIGHSPRYGIEALGMVLIALLAYSLSRMPSGLTSAIPILGAMAFAAQRLLPILQQTYANLTLIRGGEAPVSAALKLLDQPLPAYLNEPPQEPILFNDKISLKNLSFQYEKGESWVLKPELNLDIVKGSRVGFIGATGSGKSTLLDIIMGLLKPTNGSLMIDGEDINEKNYRSWQAHIAHVPQAIFLTDASIAENIAFGIQSEKIDMQRVRRAARKAQISEIIESWEHQYDTKVGERGIRLSGGQRQRIGIARALYKETDVIVFDEATSSLDNDTEAAVMKAIGNLDGHYTLIIVAHRLSTLKDCSQIVEIKDGRIERICSYKDIINKSNLNDIH